MMPFPSKKYNIIYADPPWEYGNFSNVDEASPRLIKGDLFKITPYQGMSINSIKALPISQISERDSVLLMWITYPCLQEGLEVIKAWGFEYKSVAFTWVKKNKSGIGWFMGLGNYTRANAEICVLARKGKGVPVISNSVHQVIDTPLGKHSKKPDVARVRILQLFGDLPRIELFARTKVHGWDTWGNDDNLNAQTLEPFSNHQL